MRSRTPRSVGPGTWIVGFLLAACGGATVTPPADPSAPAPTAATIASTSAPVAPAPPAPPSAPPPAIVTLAEPPPLEEPLPPLTRAFVAVTVPSIGPLIAVQGASSGDVWMLSTDDVVLRHDGKRAAKTYKRPCFPPVRNKQRSDGGYSSVLSIGDAVLLVGVEMGPRGDMRHKHAILGKDGRWDCPSSWGSPTHAVRASGDAAWGVSCDGSHARCDITSFQGAPASFPRPFADAGTTHAVDFWMRSPTDAWTLLYDEGVGPLLYHYNGVSWSLRPLPNKRQIDDLWIDAGGEAVAILGEPLSSYWSRVQIGEPRTLARWDGAAWTRLATPKDFKAKLVRGASADDLWFIEGRMVHQWDGARLRRGEAPFPIFDAWAAPNGDLWVVGAAKEGTEDTSATGTRAARLPAARKEAP